MSRSIPSGAAAPASIPLARALTRAGEALLIAMPLAMWLANRSAPLMLGLAAAAFLAAAFAAEGPAPVLARAGALLRTPVALALCAFLGWALVTLAWSHRPGLSAWGELALPLLCALAIAASARFRPGRGLARALALCVVLASALIAVELASGLSQRAALGIGRPYGFVFNRPVITLLLLAAAAAPLLWREGARDRLLAAAGLAAAGALAVYSDSGASKLGLLVLLPVWAAARWLPRLTLALVALGFAATMLLAPMMGRLIETVLPAALHQRLAEAHSRERVDIWLSFGEAVAARPLIGSGFAASVALENHPVAAAVSPARRAMLAVGHPHSAPLQAWVETGAIGAVLLLFAGLAGLARLSGLPPRALAPRLALFAAAFAIAAVAHGAWQGWWIAALASAALWLGFPRKDPLP